MSKLLFFDGVPFLLSKERGGDGLGGEDGLGGGVGLGGGGGRAVKDSIKDLSTLFFLLIFDLGGGGEDARGGDGGEGGDGVGLSGEDALSFI